MPVDPMPVDPMPVGPMSVGPMPVGPMPVDPMPVDPMPVVRCRLVRCRLIRCCWGLCWCSSLPACAVVVLASSWLTLASLAGGMFPASSSGALVSSSPRQGWTLCPFSLPLCVALPLRLCRGLDAAAVQWLSVGGCSPFWLWPLPVGSLTCSSILGRCRFAAPSVVPFWRRLRRCRL